MRRFLDGLYAAALGLSCLCMVVIAVLVLAQIGGRVLDRALISLGAAPLGFSVPSLTSFGGFLFVASASLALPATLRAGGHVRVTLLTGQGGSGQGVSGSGGTGLRRAVAGLVLLAALALASFATWHLGAQALDAWRFNSVSFGIVRVPLWIPQGVMTAGFALLALAVADELLAILRGQTPAYQQAETTRSEGGH
ncbi:MAG: TRAP transporter small permease [Roseinatronobacter sp.]